MLVARSPREQLKRQLASVVDFVDGYELDEVLDFEVARLVDPSSVRMLPDCILVHQVEACLVSRHGRVVGGVIRQASSYAIACR